MARADTKKSRRFRRPVASKEHTSTKEPPTIPSRGQRKRALKRSALLKKKSLAERISHGKQKEEEGRNSLLGDLADVRASLLRLEGEGSNGERVPTDPSLRIRQSKIRHVEVPQFAAVLQNASFKENPFQALRMHFQATLPAEQKEGRVRETNLDAGAMEKRRRQRKARGGKHSKLKPSK